MGSSGRKAKNLRPVHNASVTSIEVAKHAGVSQSTVARVFARPELVSAATRQEVIRVAESLGYLPSAIAAGMRNQRSGLIGVVVPSYGEYWQGVISEFSRQINNDSRQHYSSQHFVTLRVLKVQFSQFLVIGLMV